MYYLVKIRNFKNVADAYHYQSILKEYSIESFVELLDNEIDGILDDDELGNAMLSVLQSDSEEAIEILRQIDVEYFGKEQENTEIFNGDALVIVKQMSVAEEAYLYKARLINEGLTCFIVDKHTINPLPLVGLTASTIELYVPKKQVLLANKIIQEMDGKTTNITEKPLDMRPIFVGIVIFIIVLFLLVQQYFNMY